MTTYLGKSCSFGLPRVPFVNCRQFMYVAISLLVFRAGCGIWLYQFLIIAYLFTLLFRYVGLSLRYVIWYFVMWVDHYVMSSLSFRYVSLSLCYVNLLFRYVDSSFCYANISFRYVGLSFCYVDFSFRYVSFTLSLFYVSASLRSAICIMTICLYFISVRLFVMWVCSFVMPRLYFVMSLFRSFCGQILR